MILLATVVNEKLVSEEKFYSVFENLGKFEPYAQRFGPEIERIFNHIHYGRE